MSTYPAAARRGDSPNSSPRTARIELFIIHHYAGFTPPDQAWNRFMTANDRDVCPTWQVNADGSVFECMDPDRRRPWTSGAVDNRAVTVETQNITGAPDWLCSDASHEAIAALVAFAHARWGIPLDRSHVIGHREAPGAYATACPGGINLDWIVTRAIQITQQGEDDMFTNEDRARLDATYAGVFGAANLGAPGVDELTWSNPEGGQKSRYGLLPIVIHNQSLIMTQAGQIAALTKAVGQMAQNGGNGTIDMNAIAEAAEAGAKEALEALVLVARGE